MQRSFSLALNPVAILYALNTGVALLVSFGLPLSQTGVAAVTTIATAVLSLIAAFTARPVALGLLSAAATSLLTAAAAFGLNLTADQTGLVVAVLSLVVGLLTHQAVIPQTAAKQGKTAHELQLGR